MLSRVYKQTQIVLGHLSATYQVGIGWGLDLQVQKLANAQTRASHFRKLGTFLWGAVLDKCIVLFVNLPVFILP